MTKRDELVLTRDTELESKGPVEGLQRGDHLFYYRGGSTYSHHGVYLGNGRVVHYESSIWMKLVGARNNAIPTIREVELEEFRQGADLFVRRYDVEDCPEAVVSRANSRLNEAAYSLFENNCEHFATWCKTGQTLSTQVDAHRRASQSVIEGLPLGMSLLRAARRVPRPYRPYAYAAALAAAGGVYATSYFARRMQDMQRGWS